VANANPNVVANYLNSLISSIKRIFPRTNIVVVGHSNGGLIAEQWWLNHRDVARGIQQVFSLDSPLNGLFDAGFCSIDLCAPFGVSAQLGDYYSALWSSQSKNDPYWATLDAKDKAFTAVGSYGDPLYDVGDNGATTLPTTDARIGIVSQLYFAEPSCAADFADLFDLSTARCRRLVATSLTRARQRQIPSTSSGGRP
jgi:pimeloyl-ACP methyl ester carboxylesterase